MEQKWTTVIKPKTRLLDLKLNEIWQYKDLIIMFVKRDFKTLYKQTILGPLWIIINPLLTTFMQIFIFGGIAGLSTDGTPQFVFYMGGNAVWLYFSSCFTKTANTFVNNSAVFGKVYFPRLVTPISVTISGMVTFFAQFAVYIIAIVYYYTKGEVHPNVYVCFSAFVTAGTGDAFLRMRNYYFRNDNKIQRSKYFGNVWSTALDVCQCNNFSGFFTSGKMGETYYVKSGSADS